MHTIDELVDYLYNSRKYDDLEKRIIELEDIIQKYDNFIEALEKSSRDFTNRLLFEIEQGTASE